MFRQMSHTSLDLRLNSLDMPTFRGYELTLRKLPVSDFILLSYTSMVLYLIIPTSFERSIETHEGELKNL